MCILSAVFCGGAAATPPCSSGTKQIGAHETRRAESFAPFDAAIDSLMRTWEIPGTALAIGVEGDIAYCRGFGLADVEKGRPVEPDSLFRIASVSKSLTGAAILRLADEGRIALDAPAFTLLPDITPLPQGKADPRLGDITVRDLLYHMGGWNRLARNDPLLRNTNIMACRVMGLEPPAGPKEVIRYRISRPLDFRPGTRYAYSNLGYVVLGRVIESVSGTPYEAYVSREVLSPSGVARAFIGGTSTTDRAPGEVSYYEIHGNEKVASLLNPDTLTPWPYGGFDLRAMDAAAGWVCSAPDLVRFALHLIMPREKGGLLSPAMLTTLAQGAENMGVEASDWHYGCGWRVRKLDQGAFLWHNGTLPGTSSLLAIDHDGMAWAVLMNARPADFNAFNSALNDAMEDAARQTRLNLRR